MFNANQQAQVAQALAKHGIEGEITFSTKTHQGQKYNKVIIEVLMTNPNDIELARAGFFNKRGAFQVLDALGSSEVGSTFLLDKIEQVETNMRLTSLERREQLAELNQELRQYDEVNHFSFKRNGEWLTRYEVYPDPQRFEEQSEAVPAVPVPETNWSLDRSQVVQFAFNLLGQGQTLAQATKMAVAQYYQGYSQSVAARMLTASVKLQAEVLEGFEIGFSFVEVAELFELSFNRLRSLVAGYLPLGVGV